MFLMIEKGRCNMTDTRMATGAQTWALFCITKKDYRKEAPMSYTEAAALITKLNAEKGYVSKAGTKTPKVAKTNKAKEIHEAAVKAGTDALNACTPTPMVVVDVGLGGFGGIVEGGKEYFVEGGVCGFCSIYFKANTTNNREFLAGLKAAGLAGVGFDVEWKKGDVGYSYWVRQGGQSLQRKEAFGGAFTKTLREAGIKAYMNSRMD
jgi:hypothetical protein